MARDHRNRANRLGKAIAGSAAVVALVALPGGAAFAVSHDAPLEETECPASLNGEAPGTVWCGYLTVPEDHAVPDGATIRLFVVHYLPTGDPYPDAVLDIPQLGWAQDHTGASNLREHRDYVVMDPRGTGLSEPSLACPEIEGLAPLRFATRTDDAGTRTALVAAVDECRDRLVAEGIDLAAYGLEEIAADAEDLRTALGIEQWNVRSVGSGARIAFEILRRYPEHVRATFLDSPEIPIQDLLTTGILGTRHALHELATACASKPPCDGQPLDLEQLVARQVARADETPFVGAHGAHRGVDIPILADGALHLLYIREAASWSPELIPAGVYDFEREGEGEGADDWIVDGPAFMRGYEPDAFDLDFFHHGAWLSSVCRDEMPFVDHDALVTLAGDEPGYAGAFVDAPWADACESWGVGAADPSVHEAVQSDVPALILHGRFDPYAPRPLAEEAAAMFSTGWRLEVPVEGFNVFSTDCVIELRNAWLDAPTSPPDTTCVDQLPPVEFPASLR
jgi:pimeloyl-ACP methyl ester carboxylesterase